MKGLMLKDLLNLKKQGLFFLLFIIFYGFFSIIAKNYTLFGGIITLFGVMIPITAISYDEKAKWDKYALTMPVSRNDIVLSKYILCLSLCILSGILNIALFIFVNNNIKETLITTLAFMSIGIIYFSLILPLAFKLGMEKGRIYMILAIFIPTGFIMLMPKMGLSIPSEETLKKYLYILPIFTAAFLLLSVLISIKIYKNKEI